MPTFPKSAVYGSAEMPPPDKVNPPDEAREATESPPENVEVAVEVISKLPPEMERPVEEFREVKLNPPEKVEVALDVLVNEPPVSERPPVPMPREEIVIPPVKDEVAEPVTAMSGVMTDEVAKKPEAVVVPAIKILPWTPKANPEPTEVVPTPACPPREVARYVVPVAVRPATFVCPEILAVPFTDKL